MQVFNEVFLGADVCDAKWGWMRAEWQNRASLHVHGCWCAGLPAALSREFLRGFIARRNRPAEGEGSDADGGVADTEYKQVQDEIIKFLTDVGFTVTNPTASAEGVPVDDEARQRGREEFARDMRDFDWTDDEACRTRYEDLLLNASQRHTKCGRYCLKNRHCR